MTEQSPGIRESTPLTRYDAGLLGDFGGGDVDWWHDYIRCELDRAHAFYEMKFYIMAEEFADSARRSEVMDALAGTIQWLTAALECKTWSWDTGQYEAAKEARDNASVILAGLSPRKAPRLEPKFQVGDTVSYIDYHARRQTGKVQFIEGRWTLKGQPWLLYSLTHPTYKNRTCFAGESSIERLSEGEDR